MSHPNIVAAYEVNQEGDTHYFAMEFVEGIDLARLVRQSGPLSIPQACDYIRQAALGLQHAHEKGLVHRDIKPGNLIVGRSDAGGPPAVKVLDFGLARFEQSSDRATRLTKFGNVLGTLDYISPEQAGDAREVDIRSDIFSLGCSLFFLLTGKPAFPGTDAMERMLARVLSDALSVRKARPDVPIELEQVLAKMMARDRGDRYANPAEVAAALEPWARLTTAVQRKVARDSDLPGRVLGKVAPAPETRFDECRARKLNKHGVRLTVNGKILLSCVLLLVIVAASVGFLLLKRGDLAVEPRAQVTDGLVPKQSSNPKNLPEPDEARPIAAAKSPVPLAQWTFEKDAKDVKGNLHGILHGSAKIENGRLHLDGGGALKTAHLHVDVRARTLEIWLIITNLGQTNTNVFQIGGTGPWDGIVYAQRQERKWFPGSDYDSRSQDLNGPDENAMPTELIHLALVYSPNGSIALFRNGKVYGSRYLPKGIGSTLQVFRKGQSFITLGDRFVGQIEEASLYDRALSEVEIVRLAKRVPKDEPQASPKSIKVNRISLSCLRPTKAAPASLKRVPYYVAHANGLGVLDKNLNHNSIFFLETGLANPTYISLRATNPNLPDHYIFHGDFRLHLTIASSLWTPAQLRGFHENATFKMVPGLANPKQVSLESMNYPGFFVHARENLELFIDRNNKSASFFENATFELIRHPPD